MRHALFIAVLFTALAGALPAWAKDCRVRLPADARAASGPGCHAEPAGTFREDAVRAQQPQADRGGGTTIRLGGRVRGEAFGGSRSR